MPATLTSRHGDTVDALCQRHYGRTAQVTETVLAANPGLSAAGLLLPIGTMVTMPDIDVRTVARPLTSLWD